MPLPLVALVAPAATKIIGSHVLRAVATDMAFELGGKALGKMLPSLGKDAGIADNFVPGLSTFSKAAPSEISNFNIGRLLSKSDSVKDMAQSAISSFSSEAGGNLPVIGQALRASGLIEKAVDAFGSSQNASKLLDSVKNIDFGSLAGAAKLGGAAGVFGSLLNAFQDLVETASKLTGQVADHMPPMQPSPQPSQDWDSRPSI